MHICIFDIYIWLHTYLYVTCIYIFTHVTTMGFVNEYIYVYTCAMVNWIKCFQVNSSDRDFNMGLMNVIMAVLLDEGARLTSEIQRLRVPGHELNP